VNLPFQVDQYSVFDFTLLDPHLAVRSASCRSSSRAERCLAPQAYRVRSRDLAVAELSSRSAIHARGMFVILDVTITTMGDNVGSVGAHLVSAK